MVTIQSIAYTCCIVIGAAGFGFLMVLSLFNYLDGNMTDAGNRAINAVMFAILMGVIGFSIRSGDDFDGTVRKVVGLYKNYVLAVVLGALVLGVILGVIDAFITPVVIP